MTGASALRLDSRGWPGGASPGGRAAALQTELGIGSMHIGGGGGGGGGGSGSPGHRGSAGGRYDDSKAGMAPLVQRPREEAPIYVHASGALSDRIDRDGHNRRLHELESGPTRRTAAHAGHSRATAGTRDTRESHLTQITDLTHIGSPGREQRTHHRNPVSSAMTSLGFGSRGSPNTRPRR